MSDLTLCWYYLSFYRNNQKCNWCTVMSIMNWSLQIQQKQKNSKYLENENKKKSPNKNIHYTLYRAII